MDNQLSIDFYAGSKKTPLKVQKYLEKHSKKSFSSQELSNILSLSKGTIKTVIRKLRAEKKIKVVDVVPSKTSAFLAPVFQGMNGNRQGLDVIEIPSKRHSSLGLISTLSFKKKYNLSVSQYNLIRKKVNEGMLQQFLVKDDARGYFWNYKEEELLSVINNSSECKPIKKEKKKRAYRRHTQPSINNEVNSPKKTFSFALFNFRITIERENRNRKTISNSGEDSIKI